jgi:hypothetical protein
MVVGRRITIGTGWPKSVIKKRQAAKGSKAARLTSAKFVDPRSKREISLFNYYKSRLGPNASYDVIMAWVKEKLSRETRNKSKRD